MYQEWMDGCPCLVKGCYENNIEQAQIAVEYYERNGMQEYADNWKNYIIEERQRKAEEDKLTFFGRIMKRIIYK